MGSPSSVRAEPKQSQQCHSPQRKQRMVAGSSQQQQVMKWTSRPRPLGAERGLSVATWGGSIQGITKGRKAERTKKIVANATANCQKALISRPSWL
jgi:hypothetical protein